MSVKSASRVLDIFELLVDENQGLNVSDISSQLGFPLSSTHALLKTLTSRGYLVLEPGNRHYRLGSRLYQIGHQYREDLSVVDVAQATMRQMRELCDETVSLGVFDGNDGVILVRKNETSRALRIGNPLGTRLSIYTSAMGKAIMATWPKSKILTLAESNSGNTPQENAALLNTLDDARKKGFAFDMEESTRGVCAIATSLETETTQPASSLAIVVPSARANGEAWDHLPELLVAGAAAIKYHFLAKAPNNEDTSESRLRNTWFGAGVN